MSTISLKFCFLIIITSISLNTYAQTFEEFQKQEQVGKEQLAKEQEEEKSKMQKEFSDYVKKQDQDWQDFLQKEWSNYAVFAGKEILKKPKPSDIPVYQPSSQTENPASKSSQIKPLEISKSGSQSSSPQPLAPLCKPSEAEKNVGYANFDFYGRKVSIAFDSAMMKCNISSVDQKSVSDFWEKVSATNYTPAIDRLLQVKTEMNLNDWGYILLVQDFTNQLYSNDASTARLMLWYTLVRSGYGIRVACGKSRISLLIPSLQEVYSASYLSLNGIKYYVFPSFKDSSVFTYNKDYQSAGRLVDFSISSPINFAGRKNYKSLSFNFNDKSYKVTVSYDPDLMDFYSNYPLVELGVYFNAPVSVQSKESLLEAFKPLVAGMDELTATNFLLHFVQTAFDYKTDQDQFGREKYFFSEEVLYYPYCDCEDRAVFFTYLIREILGLKTIGLDYPGHEASAVCFTSPQKGDNFMYKNNKYIMADPTYINAPVGLTMPQFDTIVPAVCENDCRDADAVLLNKIWDNAQNTGFYKGSNLKNSKTLSDGSIVLTGYFSGNKQMGPVTLNATENSNNCFIAFINHNFQVVWAKSISTTGNAVGMSVETTPSGNIIIAGTFTGTIHFADKSLTSAEGNADLFVACFSPLGSLLWINRGDLETLPKSTSTSFSVIFDNNGTKLDTKYTGQQVDERNLGLYVDDKGEIFYSGITNNTLALAGNEKPAAFASETSMNASELLNIESEKLIKQEKTERSISGLLAAIRIIKYMGISLTGAETQHALDQKNPEFKRLCPNIYKNLGKISFIKNNKGVISIHTAGGSDISFNKVKIKNNSTISISELAGGNYKVDVLSGIKVGKMVVWYNLNFIKLFNKSGNLLFDYDTDHSQVTINVRKDILN